jgi:hypothetical protein
MIALLLFGSFFLFLGLGIPVAFALGLSAVVTLVTTDGVQVLDVVPSVMFPSMSSGTLLAIPFFILAGIVMQYTGISQRLVDLAFLIFGRLRHGLAAVTIISAFFFSAISGSGPATVAAIGAILIPALVRNGYQKKHAVSLVAASGSMGIVVPPSIAFIIFAVVAAEFGSISISRLFIAGIVPGIIMALAFFIAALFVPRVRELAGLPVKAKPGAEAGPGSACRRPVRRRPVRVTVRQRARLSCSRRTGRPPRRVRIFRSGCRNCGSDGHGQSRRRVRRDPHRAGQGHPRSAHPGDHPRRDLRRNLHSHRGGSRRIRVRAHRRGVRLSGADLEGHAEGVPRVRGLDRGHHVHRRRRQPLLLCHHRRRVWPTGSRRRCWA